MKNSKKRILALILGIGVICSSALIGCGNSTVASTANPAPEQQQSESQQSTNNAKSDENQGDAANAPNENVENIKVGQTVQLNNNIDFTVTGVLTEDKVKVENQQPEVGMKFIAINWTAKNTGDKDADFDGLISALQVKDKEGKVFKRDNVKLVGENTVDVIPAGQTINGSYVIQAPNDKNLDDLLLLITGGNNTVYSFSLSNN
ncbi:DUF4352 domain-containing protein [Clostridium tarantellae]|uniref:DUF4352 domain-containing protein n=1 Tax=Clostridium tarantellae TaxID=39493 RepID=A0A6I1MW86_9CLOT|nr:DUF4352 domain-containing protein [Clostridium tarantellae]MPQ45081.1 DUF4352 domain-containing protein [Clostridium tarantellae]